ncbi:DUF1801 domain-containing protein [Rhodococcus sp. ABRD24]|uniref:DUF1801 domain-containing protein n=1 Tax=Rhodococcus sp. ABRD24 TaxID=2507582 RepID=UPI00103F8AA5|nr:DUF1801 domain-containing protein [Rhodococcus sp. ABRD24]QBJ97009.1 DUF1801 domain-containing protein [Rhodococcus sp. ABRD24]
MQEKIESFLTSLEALDDDRHEIICRVRDRLLAKHPGLDEKFQYGGILFYDGAQAYCGLFARKDYVTLELGNAAYIEDSFGYLEGRGTKEGRRHLRLHTLSDVADKHVEDYLDLTWETF